MPQQVSRHTRLRTGDPAHAGALVPHLQLLIPVLVLLSLVFLPGILGAQTRASMQVAATILRVEPSRTALGVALDAVTRGRQTSHSSLASITVDSAKVARRPQVVRIDFLRN